MSGDACSVMGVCSLLLMMCSYKWVREYHSRRGGDKTSPILLFLPHMPETRKFACPCCGFLTRDEEPGNYDSCPVCFWEDDPVQFQYPEKAGGANRVSLQEARENFSRIGACEKRWKRHVRAPLPEEIP